LSIENYSDTEETLGGYLGALYRQRFVIALVMLSAGVFSYKISTDIEPRYETAAVFYLPDATTRAGQSESELPIAPVPSGNRDGVTAAISILRTGEIRNRVAALIPEKTPEALERDVDPVVERSSMVHVFVRDADPQVAARVANTYFDVFNTFLAEIQAERLATSLEHANARLADLDSEIQSAVQIDRDRVERLLDLRETLTRTQQSLERQQLQTVPPAIMASPAEAPSSPVFPIVPLNVIIALIAGLVLGVLYAVLLDHFARLRRMRRLVKLQQVDALTAAMGRLTGETPVTFESQRASDERGAS
jgi:uncharacterized protein involved in exopolysaccharide biosynthesis